MQVRGVDGCRGGWLAADLDVASGGVAWRWAAFVDTASLLRDDAVAAVAIDVPIGLPAAGSRSCDVEARRLLGRRGVSVFPAPVRPVLDWASYAEARAVLAARGTASMSAQAFGIVRGVAAADACLSPADDDRVVECHPELAFALMGGGPGLPGKRSPAGLATRRHLLGGWCGELATVLADRPPRTPEDDALDALACAWSALRWVRGESTVLGDGSRDDRKLPMRIVA